MSKTFRENYYDSDNYGMKKDSKSNKRQKVKTYLKKIDVKSIDPDEDFLNEIDEE